MIDPSILLILMMLPFIAVGFLMANLPVISTVFVVLFVIVGLVILTIRETRRERS